MSQARMPDRPVRLYLLDVEGTTSPIAFVYERLFPYARRNFQAFLPRMGDDAAVKADLRLLAEEYEAEDPDERPRLLGLANTGATGTGATGAMGPDDALLYLGWLMDRDRKSTALKSLQGKVWRAGFESGELLGEVYPDVPPALARWSRKARVAIYSSGSVEAQRLLFRYSTAGDLTGYLAGYFDTRIGAKTARASYEAIAEVMAVAPGDILFVSDVARELDPAREAGCQTRLSVRAGNAPVADANGHPAIRSFDALDS